MVYRSGILVRFWGIVLLFMILISPVPAIQMATAQQDAGESSDLCPRGIVTGIEIFRDVVVRMLNIAESRNISIDDQELSVRIENLLNISIENLSNSTLAECREILKEFGTLIKDLVKYVVANKTAEEIQDIKNRLLIKTAEKLLMKAERLGLTNLTKIIQDKIMNGTVTEADLDRWDDLISRFEIANKSREIDDIVRRIVEQSIIGPSIGNESKALSAISIAEHVLKRVKEILEEAGASERALKALDEAIENVKNARRVLEEEAKLEIDEKLLARIDRLSNKTMELIARLSRLPIPNSTVDILNSTLSRVIEILDDARSSVLA
jgi:hypothetical protein